MLMYSLPELMIALALAVAAAALAPLVALPLVEPPLLPVAAVWRAVAIRSNVLFQLVLQHVLVLHYGSEPQLAAARAAVLIALVLVAAVALVLAVAAAAALAVVLMLHPVIRRCRRN
jgi:hypothetical protein